MTKLKHIRTAIGRSERYFMISVGGSVILEGWNYFFTLEDAEAMLFEKFGSTGQIEYQITEANSKSITYTYK